MPGQHGTLPGSVRCCHRVVVMRLEGASQMTKSIIIAVNDPNILYLLRRYAEESGFETTSASRCKDVLALLAQPASPSLIILDSELLGAAARSPGVAARSPGAAARSPGAAARKTVARRAALLSCNAGLPTGL